MTDAVRESIVVEADPDTIMDVIADFEAYPEWQSEMKEAEILETDGDGWGKQVRYKVDAKVFSAEYVLAYTYGENEMRWSLVEGDQLRKNEGVYLLEEQDDGTTLVTYELEVEPSIPMPGMLRRKAAKKIVDGALKDMKRRVESKV
jgi:ribosome-associated toxin RatA of RatAB toxin-antitoxin module